MNYTRLSSLYGSKCMDSWDETNYTEYLTDDIKDWPYTENVRRNGYNEKKIHKKTLISSNVKGSACSLLGSIAL